MTLSHIKSWLPVVIIVALIAAVWFSGIGEYLSLDAIKAQRQELQAMVSAHPVLSVLAFIALYMGAVALSLPFGTVLSLLGGFLFGAWMGTFSIVIGATLGAMILFLIARSALGETLRVKAGPLYNKVAANMTDNAVGYMLFMRLVPLFPFFLVNIVPALFNVKLIPYVLTTFVGIIPGTFVYANLGKELGTIDTLGDLVSPQTLLAFTLLGVFAVIPTLYNQFKVKKIVSFLILAALLFMGGQAQAVGTQDQFLSLYDGLLKAHTQSVQKGDTPYIGVKYDAWKADPRHKQALDILLAYDPSLLKGDARKAYWINTYNFLTIDLIVREGERKSIKNLGGTLGNPWKKFTWTIAGKSYTLDQIEHKILRPMGDPRIHVGINCASVSCPDLRREAYRATKLNAQLNEQVEKTLQNKGKGMRVEGKKVLLSKIFDWFSDDFAKGNPRQWLQQYTTIDPSLTLDYLPYDWSLNKVQ